MKSVSSERKSISNRAHFFLTAAHAAALIIGAAAIFYYFVFFPPVFRGWPETTSYNSVAGWVVNEASPVQSVEVELYVDNQFVAHATADLPRADVVAAGRAKTDRCGFNFDLPTLARGTHEAQVYAVHKVYAGGAYRTLQRIGKPLRLEIS
jgi:hypothetical protein